MTQKQQQLLFDKGITNVPSDVLCSDNTLAESVGMVYDNGEHRVIQRPVETITSWLDAQEQPSSISATLLYIHKYNDKERYIAHKSDGSIIWGIKDGNTFRQKGDLTLSYSDGTSVTSVGKTL
ncbi:MAG: hypothetical protein IJ868_05205, partial [Prevotella sp.]|nr:hypothetical protein [Prevotella sp.]